MTHKRRLYHVSPEQVEKEQKLYIIKLINMFKELKEEIKNTTVPAITKFVEIPNVSRAFDPDWKTNKMQHKAIDFCIEYLKTSKV